MSKHNTPVYNFQPPAGIDLFDDEIENYVSVYYRYGNRFRTFRRLVNINDPHFEHTIKELCSYGTNYNYTNLPLTDVNVQTPPEYTTVKYALNVKPEILHAEITGTWGPFTHEQAAHNFAEQRGLKPEEYTVGFLNYPLPKTTHTK